MREAEDDVALKLLHTADWHLGRRFPSFETGDQVKLSRARLEVLDRILGVAEQYRVDGILCAGDLFDEPDPGKDWWEPLASKLGRARGQRPIFLLPGNHDPLMESSVYWPGHLFRAALPPWVQVVDRDDFSHAFGDVGVLWARPCRSRAGQEDPALALPAREPGDERIRVGLVHGSTFDMPDCQTNFPIAKDAAVRRGFDYLALGDTHSFRNVQPPGTPPVVYPGAPEPTCFDEPDAGHVAVVFISHDRRVRVHRERVATWQWTHRHIGDIGALRALREENLSRTVLRLTLDLSLPAHELAEAEAILREIEGTAATRGRAEMVQRDVKRLVLDSRGLVESLTSLPGVLQAAARRLIELEKTEQAETARAALFLLYQLTREVRR